MRYVVIDFMHLPHLAKFLNPLSAPIMIDDKVIEVNTTVANFVVKSVFNKSGRGDYYTAILLDGTHLGGSYRKEYFRELYARKGISKEYKGSRGELPDFFNAVELSQMLLDKGKVSMYRQEKLEADDLVASIINKIRFDLGDTTTPIDIYTNDNDIIPFVDDQVSVYIRSPRTYSEFGCPQATKYFQVTPNSWYEYLGGTSEFKGYHIPYNSMLLYKLLKGDKSDEYVGVAPKGAFGKVGYSKVMQQMEADGVDFANVFRYNKDFNAHIRPVLEPYFDKVMIDGMEEIYVGINPITSLDGQTWLYQSMLKPLQISEGHLQLACSSVGINLNA